MKKLENISEIMTTELVTLQYNDDLMNAENLFKQHHIRHMPVLKQGAFIGILSYNDILRMNFGTVFNEHESHVDSEVSTLFSVEQVMTKKMVTVSPNTTIEKAAKLFATSGHYAIPVIKSDELVGIVTTSDLIKSLLS